MTLQNGLLSLRFDAATGFLCQMARGPSMDVITAAGNAAFTLHTDGSFSHVPDFNMNSELRNGHSFEPPFRLSGSRSMDRGDSAVLVVEQSSPEWILRTTYAMDRHTPLVEMDFELEYTGTRALTLDCVALTLPPLRLAHPAAPVWADIGNATLRVRRAEPRALVAAWRLGDGDHASIAVVDSRFVLTLFLGGRITSGRILSGGGFWLAALADEGISSLDVIKDSFSRKGLSAQGGTPRWVRPAHIYETFIGSWPMDGDGRSYAPYPTTDHLVRDLPRVRGMGFTVLYLMPRHPYPSYSVASFTDLGLQYGDGPGTSPAMLKLIEAAHAQEMRVLLDVILHGGLDASALAVQKERQEHFREETAGTDAAYDAKVVTGQMLRHWIVYEKAHEPFWRQSVPEVHPFWAEHPEWFTRRKDGTCQYTYTRAFNLRHRGFQDFFAAELLRCVEEFGVDGFRFDAPFWTVQQYDWEEKSQRASWSAGGCIEILARAHRTIAERNPHVCFYVESMDNSITRTAHLQYTYDTYWGVIEALGRKSISAADARQRLAFIARTRIEGIVDVNTVDSHDTCWWFKVGSKWARERYSAERARLLFALICFLDGGVQMFSGGETHMEELVRRLLALRLHLPVLQSGACSVESVACTSPDVIPIWRESPGEWLCPLVNFAAGEEAFEVQLPSSCPQGDQIMLHHLTPGTSGSLRAQGGTTVSLTLLPGAISLLCSWTFWVKYGHLLSS